MISLIGQLAVLLALTLPIFLATGLLVCLANKRFQTGWSTAEQLLAVLILAPLLPLAELAALGYLPFPRPLDWLLLFHGGICIALLLWCHRHRDTLASWLLGSRDALTTATTNLPISARIVITIGAAALLASTIYGLWTVPFEQDAAGYHLPQAIQPWQDGRLGPVHSDLVYADSYPRASALLWFWTMAIARTDAAFDLVATWYALMLTLAGYIAARRAGAARGISLTCSALAPTVPMFAMLCSIKQIDMHTSGLIAAAMALALPREARAKSPAPTDPTRWPLADQLLAGICLTLAMWMKFLPIAMIGLIASFRVLISVIQTAPLKAKLTNIPRITFWVLCIGLASCGPYVQTWLQYGTPVYPYKLELLGTTIFDGPLSRQMISGESSMAWAERFRIFWVDWTHPLGPQQPSGFGPIWPFLLLPLSIIFALSAAAVFAPAGRRAVATGAARASRAQPVESTPPAPSAPVGAQEFSASSQHITPSHAPQSAHKTNTAPPYLPLAILTGLALIAALILPHHHWSRYTLWLLPLSSACLAVLLTFASTPHTRPLLSGTLAFIAALQLWGITLFWQSAAARLSPLLAESKSDLFTPARMWPLIADSYKQDGRSPNAATRRWIYDHMPRGGLLITTVSELHGLLYDWQYNFAVEYRTPAERDLWADQTKSLTAGSDRAQQWLQEITTIASGRPLMVLCYTGSTEDATLANPTSGFTLAHEQPKSQGPFPVRIYTKNMPQ